jgi:hypothetical protein
MDILGPKKIVIALIDLNPVFTFRSFPTVVLAEALESAQDFPDPDHLHRDVNTFQ